MKAVFFQKPLEFSLEINGEVWHQGDTVQGKLSVKNHGTDQIDLKDAGVTLALGNTKKVKTKEADAFTVISEKTFKDSEVSKIVDVLNLDFEFQLSEDCEISENAKSFHLICHTNENLHDIGHMRLNIIPAKTLSDFLEVLLDNFRIKTKSFKNKKDGVEATMVVPDQKDFSNIGQYKILMKMDGDQLNLKHQFKIKKISFEDGVQKVKDEGKSLVQSLSPEDYLIYGKALNRDGISKRVEEILEQVKFKPLI